MLNNTYLNQISAKPQIVEELGFEEWLELAPIRKISPLIVTFAKTSKDLLLPNNDGRAETSLSALTQLSRDLQALGGRDTKALLGIDPDLDVSQRHRESSQALAAARFNAVTERRFMELYDTYSIVADQVRACVNGKLDLVTGDLREALLNYNENKAIINNDVLSDLYTEEQVSAAHKHFVDAECFLANLVPMFINALGRLPQHKQVVEELEKFQDKTGRLAQYGVDMMKRFVKALELLPENLVAEQVQAVRDLSTRSDQWNLLKAYTRRDRPFNIGMGLLGAATESLNVPSVFFEHLYSVVEAAEFKADADISDMNF